MINIIKTTTDTIKTNDINADVADIKSEIKDDHPARYNTTNLQGMQNVWQTLSTNICKNQTTHILLLHGIKGIGKSKLAFMIARELLNDDKNSISTLSHFDFYFISSEYNANSFEHKNSHTISIDEIRDVRKFLYTTTSIGTQRVLIIDDADTMTINAGNALLKMLEEPINGTNIILVTSKKMSILRTIISRCNCVLIPTPSIDAYTIAMKNLKITNDNTLTSLYQIFRGSIGQSFKFMNTFEYTLTEPPLITQNWEHNIKNLARFVYDNVCKCDNEEKHLLLRRFILATLTNTLKKISLIDPVLVDNKKLSLYEKIVRLCKNAETAHLDNKNMAYNIINLLI